MKKINNKYLYLLIWLILGSTIPNVSGQKQDFGQFPIAEFENGATRLTFKMDDQGNRHFIYLDGPSKYSQTLPLLGEPYGEAFNGTHVLKYGTLNFSLSTSGNSNLESGVVKVENVTNELVYPYSYNFIIDSNGRIHTAYISKDHVLYYAVRYINGTWINTQLTQPDYWYAIAPDIALGENDQPRIVYSAIYKKNASKFFGLGASLNSFRALHYTAYNGSTWKTYDLTENNKAFFNTDPSRLQTYNPGIMIEKGQVYVAYTNRNQVSLETMMRYLTFKEFPDDIINDPQKSFDEITFKYIYAATVVSSIFSKPTITRMGDGVTIVFGAWVTGGVSVSYLANAFEKPIPDKALQSLQWETISVDPQRRNRQVETVAGKIDSAGNLNMIWSLYDLFDTARGRFTFDVYTASFKPDGSKIGNFNFSRITALDNIIHTYPNFDFDENGDREIVYFEYKQNQNPVLTISYLESTAVVEKGAEKGFGNVLFGLVLIVVLWFLLVRRISPPEKIEEILPHQVNLKDAIEEH